MKRYALLAMVQMLCLVCSPDSAGDRPVVAIGNRAASEPIMLNARNVFTFAISGVVQSQGLTSDQFVVDDGSGLPVRVLAAGHSAYGGCCVSARGSLDPTAVPPTLTSQAVDVIIRLAGPQSPPTILTHPSSVLVVEGQTAPFNVVTMGTGLSYQWQRSNDGGGVWGDVTAGSGRWTASYTTAAAVRSDSEAQFRCIVSNAAGSVTSSAATLAVNSQSAAITLNDFPNYRVFQRDIGLTSRSVPVVGTCSGMSRRRVDARVVRHDTGATVVDWTTIDTAQDDGPFSGSLSVPQGPWYRLEVRACDATGTVLGSRLGTNKWGVGMLILVIGQSNMSGRGKRPFTPAVSDLAVNCSNAGVWEYLADPYDDDSPPGAVDNDNDTIASTNSGGSMIPAIANSLLQTYEFPIAFVPSAKGGSPLYVNPSNYGWSYRNPSNHQDTATLYGQSITKAWTLGGVELIIMHQGEADLEAGRTQAQYEADFARMVGNYREDLYPGIPIFICQIGTVGAGTHSGAVGIRNAQRDVDNGTDVFMGATAMDLARFDIWHYDTPALNVIGTRLANAIRFHFGDSGYYRGPSVNSAAFSDGNRNQVIVTISHRGGTDITPAAGITGFEVFDNGSAVTVQSAVRHAPDAVRLVLSRSILPGQTATLRYLYGRTPNVTGLVKDNSPLALPLENTAASIAVSPAP